MTTARKRYAPAPLLAAALAAALGTAAPADNVKPPEKPADVLVTVTPERSNPGGEVRVRVRLEPIRGVKINRYPKIKLTVPEQAGLVAAGEAEVGNAAPPPPGGDPEANYYDRVDPLDLSLTLDPAIAPGHHEIEGRLVYAYCVSASGFCTRTKVPLRIPLTIGPS